MFHVKHYLFISVFIINNISLFLLCYYFPGNISMFHLEHYLFIFVLLSTTSIFFTLLLFPRKYFYVPRGTLSIYLRFYYQLHPFFLLYNYFPGNISMFHVEHYLFISAFIINNIFFFLL